VSKETVNLGNALIKITPDVSQDAPVDNGGMKEVATVDPVKLVDKTKLFNKETIDVAHQMAVTPTTLEVFIILMMAAIIATNVDLSIELTTEEMVASQKEQFVHHAINSQTLILVHVRIAQ